MVVLNVMAAAEITEFMNIGNVTFADIYQTKNPTLCVTILEWISAKVVLKVRDKMREVRCAEDVCEECPFAECFIDKHKTKVPLATGEMVRIKRDYTRTKQYTGTIRVNKHKGR